MKTSPSIKLKDICSVIDCEHKTAPIEEDGIPSIRTPNIGKGRLILDGVNRVSEKTYREWTRRAVPHPGDLIMAREAPVGNIAIIPQNLKVCLGQRTVLIQPQKDKVSPEFLNYFLNSGGMNSYLLALSNGATVEHLNVGDIRELVLPSLPVLPVQKKIAAVVSTYDDLIENNNRRIAILEKMAEEIYREWFVRMRFPGHEKAKFHKGVPEGWEETPLRKLSKMVMGQSPKSEFYNTVGDGLPFNQGVGTYGNRFPRKETFCSVKGRLAEKGDVLFSVRAPVGRLNIADCKMIIGRGLAAIREKHDLNSYLFYPLKQCFQSEDVIGNGAIFNSVGKNELEAFKILYPGDGLAKAFNSLAAPLDRQIENFTQSLDVLTRSRDLLLSRLITGKLSVEDLDIKFPPSMLSPEPVEGKEADG